LFPELPTERELKEAEKAFHRAWDKLRKRFLVIGGEAIGLVEQRKQAYQSQLREVLRRLRPELTPERLEEWHGRLLRRILGPDVDGSVYQIPGATSDGQTG
jgi:hypothetical protein